MNALNLQAPPPHHMLFETLTWIEFPRLAVQMPGLLQLEASSQKHIVVFPGFGAGNLSTSVLRQYLTRLGHDVSGWNLGSNSGEVEEILPLLVEDVASRGHNVTLIGWSLGGYLAREVARELPGVVDQVFTMGSPVRGGPKYTQVAAAYRQRGYNLDEIEQLVLDREQTPLEVPVTALYSKRDGVVSWEACIDPVSDDVEHIQVNTSHSGFGFCPDVFRLIAERLA